MSARRPDGLDPKSYEARRKSNNPQVSITIRREALDRLDEIRRDLPRGVMIAILIQFWDSKPKKRKG